MFLRNERQSSALLGGRSATVMTNAKRFKRVCVVCDKPFDAYHRTNISCSTKCRRERNKELTRQSYYSGSKRVCYRCKEVEVPPGRRVCDKCSISVSFCQLCGKRREYRNVTKWNFCVDCYRRLRRPKELQKLLDKIVFLESMQSGFDVTMADFKEILEYYKQENMKLRLQLYNARLAMGGERGGTPQLL